MRTEQCYCVIEAVKTGSFSKAAENLYLKRSSLRTNINKLEEEFGQALFERSKSGCKLTEFGEWCYPYIMMFVQTYEMIKNKAIPEEVESPPLFIGATRTFEGVLRKSYDLYETQNHGRKCVFFSSIFNDEVLQKVIDHKLDIGLISYLPLLWKENKWFYAQLGRSFDMVDICDIRYVALMKKDHPLAQCEKISVNQMKDYLLVFSNYAETVVLDVIRQELKEHQSELHVARVTENELLNKYLLEENAISFTFEKAGKNYYPDITTYVAVDDFFLQRAVALCPKGGFNENTLSYINIVRTLLN